VSGKKRPKYFFVISCIKLGRFRWNLIHSFPNKFSAKSCKRFPPHLNNVSTLPCETLNVHSARATAALSEKVTLIPPQLWPPNSPDLNHADYSVWEILQEKVYRKRITDLAYRRRHWRMAVTMTTWSILAHSVLRRSFSSSRSVMSVLNTFSCNIPNTL